MEVYKKYARLLFNKQSYEKAREVLLEYPHAHQDMNIKYMICETLLKEKKYGDLYEFINNSVIHGSEPEI